MAEILRGEIWWVRLDPTIGHEQRGKRPILVVSENRFNRASQTPIGMALTSQEPAVPYPLSYRLVWPGQRKQSWVKISQIRVLDASRFESKLGEIDKRDIEEVLAGLDRILGR